jgi:hypothetical protein
MFSFVGSRSLSSVFSNGVSSVLSSVACSASPVSVGCCVGLDSLVLRSVLGNVVPLSAVQCFSAFSQKGEGICRASAVQLVSEFARAGGTVTWLAGGALSLNIVPRLVLRTRAVVSSAPSGCAVFIDSPLSRGSLGAASFAVSKGIPVFLFACGFPRSAVPLLKGVPGKWVSSTLNNFPCLEWSNKQPRQKGFF